MSVETVYRCDVCRRTPGSKGETPTGRLGQWRQIYITSEVLNPKTQSYGEMSETFVENGGIHLCDSCLSTLGEALPPNTKLRR